MVMPVTISGKGEVGRMVCGPAPGMLKRMVSGPAWAFASMMAARRVRTPDVAVLTTPFPGERSGRSSTELTTYVEGTTRDSRISTCGRAARRGDLDAIRDLEGCQDTIGVLCRTCIGLSINTIKQHALFSDIPS